VWEPPVQAHAYAGYLTKYSAKRLGMAEGSEDPVPPGCCRFTYSRGLMPTRAQWAVLRVLNKARFRMSFRQFCAGEARAYLEVDGCLHELSARSRFWVEPWFNDVKERLVEELGFDMPDEDGPIYAFTAKLLAVDEERWHALGVKAGESWDGKYRRPA